MMQLPGEGQRIKNKSKQKQTLHTVRKPHTLSFFSVKKIFLVLLMAFQAFSSAAQVIISMSDTAMVSADQAPMSAPPIMAESWNQHKTKFFTLNIGLAFLLDHNIVSQDEANLDQVGKVDPATEFRGERFVVSGTVSVFKNHRHPWRYMISANYNGLDGEDDSPTFSFIDWNFEIPFGKRGGWLTAGKQKEGVGHEYVLPGTQSMFMERGSGAPIFIRQRNIGIRYSNSILNQRLTYTAGFFNNWWETGKSFADNGSQVTARVTALPVYTSDRQMMHVAVAYRYSDATDGKLSYKGKPEVNSAPAYVNTGTFDASGANTLLLEWIGVSGPVALIGEYMNAFVNSNSAGNPSFSYWQFGGSWFITGENRKYNRKTGNMGKLFPNKTFTFKKGGGPGAIEVGARYTYSDLADGNVFGGEFGRFTGALSWFPNTHLRFEMNYGAGKLERNNLTGKADFWQFRAQIEL